MKRILVVLLLLIIPISIASTFNAKYIGEEVIVGDWNITVKDILGDSTVYFEVKSNSTDAESALVTFQIPTRIKGVRINTTEVFYDPDKAYRIVWFTAEEILQHACFNKTDCNDNLACTIDYCYGEIRECHYVNITTCVDGDGCCDSVKCRWFNDNDCIKPCDNDDACNDKNESTKDTCESAVCKNKLITACENGDNYCPDGCFLNESTAANSDNDCSRNSKCISHTDCDDNDNSTVDRCWSATLSTEPKYCQNIINESYIKPTEINDTKEESENQTVQNESSNNKTEDNQSASNLSQEESKESIWEQLTWWKIILILVVILIPLFLFVSLRNAKY